MTVCGLRLANKFSFGKFGKFIYIYIILKHLKFNFSNKFIIFSYRNLCLNCSLNFENDGPADHNFSLV